MVQVLRRYERSGLISADRGTQALGILVDFPLARYPHLPLLERIWQLRQGVTAYDAAYLALAEALDARLVTRDHALAGTGSRVRVEVI